VVSEPLAVGLAGAGPWARAVHAPTLAAGPETRLAGVWSRTEASAEALAGEHGVPAFPSFDALLDACDAVAFAVPPFVQPDLAVAAARAGKALLLEKPLGLDVDGARRIADAVGEAGVGSVVLLTYRFSPVVREFLERVPDLPVTGGRACFLSGAFLGGPFVGGWRAEHGVLLDIGPHILDLVDAALGPVVEVRGHGDPRHWVGLLLDHESGARSEVSMSCTAAITPSRTELEVFGPEGSLTVDGRAGVRAESFALLRRELAETARRGGGHPCDAARGLHVQELVARATAALGG
jgi:predicted dehydrogenase